ncbi:MAG: FKBP-type peptidyl-prolyl cis-trans isomerase [Actinomycetota bacterium]|nr:FKBP-type peptidyl-prolyl cis-trans isomerase [Actinomycetota bacterium]
MSRAAALFIALALVVTGCSSGSDDEPSDDPITESSVALDGIKVGGGFGVAPTVEIDTPFTIESTTRDILVTGTGDEVTSGDTVTFHLMLVNGKDESVITNTFETQPAVVIANSELLAGIRKALLGTKVGSRVLVAISSDDGYGPLGGDPASGIGEDDTLVLVADIINVRRPLSRASGTAVTPPAGLPTVTADEQGRTSIVVPKTAPPTQLVVQPLIRGNGNAVESGQTVLIHYTGVIWGSGDEFDSSWANGSPTEYKLDGDRFAAFNKGLVGQTVGSQVLLVVPPADGYGEEGAPDAGISPTDTLVFVVDILHAG